MTQARMTYRQRALISRLYDERELPAAEPGGRRPGIGKWNTAKDVAFRRTSLTVAEASRLISFLLTLPEKVRS